MKSIIIILLLGSYSFGQNLKNMEQKFFNLEKQYLAQLTIVDSLKNALDTFLIELDKVRKDDASDKDEISDMMARALEQGSKVDRNDKKLENMEKQLLQIRQKLHKAYTIKIDSLERMGNAEQTQLRDLKNKKLYVSPLLTQITFDPRLVEKIKLSDSHDEKEVKIYREYLMNALNEVDSNIVNLHERSKNIREVLRLNEKAEDFLDDIAGDQFSGTFVIAEKTVFGEVSFGRDNSPIAQVNTVARIYNRISPYIYEHINTYDYTLQDSVYTEDYLKLLDETEKTLKLYRERLKDKLQ